MPWKTSSVMEEKLRFVFEYDASERTMTELCQHYGISRETGYIWLRRYRATGVAGLVEPGRVLPATSTIGALLQREGLVVARRKRTRTAPYSAPLAHADEANRVWCADFKGWFRTADNNIFFGSTPTSFANGDFRSEKGSAASDLRHRFVVSSSWTPAFTKSTSAWARYLVNNWELSQVTTLQSAKPVDSTTIVNGNAFTGALVSGSLNGLGGDFSRVPFQPVDNLNLDQVYRVDARLAKRLPFTERVTGYLQFEAFNLFNTPYDTSRRTDEYSLNNATGRLSFIGSYGTGNSTATSPDGTNARRAQLSLRIVF